LITTTPGKRKRRRRRRRTTTTTTTTLAALETRFRVPKTPLPKRVVFITGTV